MKKELVFILLIFTLMIATSVSARVGWDPSLTCVQAKSLGLITGSINGGNAQVINNAGASYNVGLAIYKVFDAADHDTTLEHQVLFDSDTGNVGSGNTLNLAVDLPGCQYQIDLFCGDVLQSFANGVRYNDRKFDYDHKRTGNFCQSCSNGYGTDCNGPTNNCGASTSGTQLCDGTCSVKVAPANPAGYGNSCESTANACGLKGQGTIQCDSSCNAVTPANPENHGKACTSPANACGQTAEGTIQCDGSCSAIPPTSTGCGGDDGDNEVPVFPGFTVGLAVIGAGLGVAMLRKQE